MLAVRPLVPIDMALRFDLTCEDAAKHSAIPELDNCYRDYAQQNARELAAILHAEP